MSKLMRSVLFLLVATMLAGCLTDDTSPDPNGPEEEENRKTFEVGRLAESKGDIGTAETKYRGLVKKGNFYGDYGLAMLLLRRDPVSREAVSLLLSCAQRTRNATEKFPLCKYESAFSAAAMAKLTEIAAREHGWQDIAESLRGEMFGTITLQDRERVEKMKGNANFKMIYKDIITAVESSRKSHDCPKPIDWPKVCEMFKNGGSVVERQSGARTRLYTLVNSGKVSDSDKTYQYDFEARLTENGTADEIGKVLSDIRRLIIKNFLDENGDACVADVRISLRWTHQELTIKGSGVVFKMSVARGEYDEVTGRGWIVVRLDGRDMKAAREWVRENIAELVADNGTCCR